jgi:hypothetical protein
MDLKGRTMTEQIEALRAWAKGVYTCEAATELLIRGFGGRFIKPGNPWIGYDPIYKNWWIDFAVIPEESGALSGGERRFLQIVASIGGEVPVELGDCLSMDREYLKLVLAAISHASGSHQDSGLRVSDDGTRMIRDPSLTGALYPWP